MAWRKEKTFIDKLTGRLQEDKDTKGEVCIQDGEIEEEKQLAEKVKKKKIEFDEKMGAERTLRMLDLKKKHNVREFLYIYPIDIYTMSDGDGHFLKLFNKKDVPQGFTKSSSLTMALQTYECSGKSGEAGTLELMKGGISWQEALLDCLSAQHLWAKAEEADTQELARPAVRKDRKLTFPASFYIFL